MSKLTSTANEFAISVGMGLDLLFARDPNKYLIWEPVWWSPAINLYDFTMILRFIQDMFCFETEQPLVSISYFVIFICY